jgi:hypothetical protein
MLLFTANENWVIPAGMDSRRFMVLRVSDLRMGDDAYWAKYMPLLYKNHKNEPNNPEYLGRILHFFLSRKISHSLSRALVTQELIEQRRLTNADSMDAAFVEWVRQTFIKVKADESEIQGAGKEFTFTVVTYMGASWVESADFYADFRRYYNRYHSKGRGVGTDRDFKERMIDIGVLFQRVKKRSIKVGAGKYPGEPESRITIAQLPSTNAIEKALATLYPLFMEYEDEEAEENIQRE